MKSNSSRPEKETAAFLAAVLENLAEGIVACDVNGTLTTFNRAALEFHNLPASPIPAEQWASHYNLFLSDGKTPMRKEEVPLYRALAGETVKDQEMTIVSGNSKRTVLCNGKSIFDEHGQKLGAVITMQDISAFKNASAEIENFSRRLESEKRFRALFEQNPLSVQLLSVDGRTLQVNRAWKELWGFTDEFVENFILKQYNMLQDEELVKKGIMPIIKAGFSGQGGRIPAIYYDVAALGNGRGRWVEGFINPIFSEDGKVTEIVLIHQDVTEKVRSDEELKAARDAAQEANRLKSAFLANMSHEIRTPLAGILGFSQLLKDGSSTPEETAEFLEIIDRNGKALTKIIDDILDLSKVEAGRLVIETEFVNLEKLLQEVLSLFRKTASSRGIRLACENNTPTETFFKTDQARLRQILINLVGNAMKFTQQGEIVLKVDVQNSEEASYLKISVCDTGLGIPKELQTELFQAFNQIDSSRTRQYGGTGLGLVLSRRLAEAMGGDVYLEESLPQKGSVFVVILPFITKASEDKIKITETTTFEVPENALLGRKILVVDDAVDNRTLLHRMLNKAGAIVVEAANGAEAVEKAKHEQFAIVLMDVQMPVMDGFQAIQKLRENKFASPIIALTAHAMKEERDRCISAGANAHFAKPIVLKELLELMLRLISQSKF